MVGPIRGCGHMPPPIAPALPHHMDLKGNRVTLTQPSQVTGTHSMGNQLVVTTATPHSTAGDGDNRGGWKRIVHAASLKGKGGVTRGAWQEAWLTWMLPGSLSCVASMNMACVTLGLRMLPEGEGKKLATGLPP